MQRPEQTNQQAANLHWLAFLLTGSCQTGVDLVVETIALQDAENPFFSHWMLAWSRRVVIGKALTAIRTDLARSARATQLQRAGNATLPPRTWTLDQGTTKVHLERALLAIDAFPRAAVLLLVFERVPLKDAATLLDADPALVRKGQMVGLQQLTVNLAQMQGWASARTTKELPQTSAA